MHSLQDQLYKEFYGVWPTAPSTKMADDNTSGSGTTTDTTPIVVNIVVKPVLEGQTLSAKSRVEIQQAASRGANEALRAYNGR